MTLIAALSAQGDRYGQPRAKGQSGSQETQEGKDQDDCSGSKSEARCMAAGNRLRQKEIGACRRVPDIKTCPELSAKIDAAQNDAGRIAFELARQEFPRGALLDALS